MVILCTMFHRNPRIYNPACVFLPTLQHLTDSSIYEHIGKLQQLGQKWTWEYADWFHIASNYDPFIKNITHIMVFRIKIMEFKLISDEFQWVLHLFWLKRGFHIVFVNNGLLYIFHHDPMYRERTLKLQDIN